jgi:outer membrane murein-binding lipoprotein Lpp
MGRLGVSLAATLLTASLLLVLSGCGGATAPCPTPTTELDQLRSRSDRLEHEMEQVTQKDDEIGEAREGALRRVTEAQAEIDSITDAHHR